MIGSIRGSNLIDEILSEYGAENWAGRSAILSGVLEEVVYAMRYASLAHPDSRGSAYAWEKTLDIIQSSLEIGVARSENDFNEIRT